MARLILGYIDSADAIYFLQRHLGSSIELMMADLRNARNGDAKIMLGFIVRRCAADIGHTPTPAEFATWANGQQQNGKRLCLFGKEISPSIAKVMFNQPGRLVTVSAEGLARIWKSNGR
ncbi:MAG: hypothetical protein ACM3N3_22390 [Betaproteobacteria bacterium]